MSKSQEFRRLHEAAGTFVIANAWDAGSAKLLTALGFKALATSSGAQAGILGRVDGQVNREEALAHASAIVNATQLPVSADLEKGFGDSPDDAARTITQAAAPKKAAFSSSANEPSIRVRLALILRKS